jgi:hypothetical protein
MLDRGESQQLDLAELIHEMQTHKKYDAVEELMHLNETFCDHFETLDALLARLQGSMGTSLESDTHPHHLAEVHLDNSKTMQSLQDKAHLDATGSQSAGSLANGGRSAPKGKVVGKQRTAAKAETVYKAYPVDDPSGCLPTEVKITLTRVGMKVGDKSGQKKLAAWQWARIEQFHPDPAATGSDELDLPHLLLLPHGARGKKEIFTFDVDDAFAISEVIKDMSGKDPASEAPLVDGRPSPSSRQARDERLDLAHSLAAAATKPAIAGFVYTDPTNALPDSVDLVLRPQGLMVTVSKAVAGSAALHHWPWPGITAYGDVPTEGPKDEEELDMFYVVRGFVKRGCVKRGCAKRGCVKRGCVKRGCAKRGCAKACCACREKLARWHAGTLARCAG